MDGRTDRVPHKGFLTMVLVLAAVATLEAAAGGNGSLLPTSRTTRGRPSPDAAAGRRPNLRVDSVRVLPPAVVVGGQMVVLTRIRNQGTAVAKDFAVRVAVDGQEAPFSSLIASLAAGATTELRPAFRVARAGPCQVSVTVDPTDAVAETNEKDNSQTLVVTVQPRNPLDLRIERLTMEPAAPAPGSTVLLKAVLINVGDVTSPPCHAEVRVDGEASAPSLPVPGLPSMATATVERRFAIGTRQRLTVVARVDTRDEVAEVNEGNNQSSILFRLGDQPVLRIAEAEAMPRSPKVGDRLVVRAWIENAGNVEAGRFAVEFRRQGDEKVLRSWVSSLASGEAVTVGQLYTDLTAGRMDFSVRIVPPGDHAGSDDSKGVTVLQVTVRPAEKAPRKGGRRR